MEGLAPELGAVWLFVAADCVVSCDSWDTAASNPDVACAMVVASPVSADKVVAVPSDSEGSEEAAEEAAGAPGGVEPACAVRVVGPASVGAGGATETEAEATAGAGEAGPW